MPFMCMTRSALSGSRNFFELGGNSLLGMDLAELLASRLGIQNPVVMLFRRPTVREMMQIIIAGAQS